MAAIDIYKEWLNHSGLDAELKRDLRRIVSSTAEIEERFYRNLDFGTAGMRGIMGAGTNRMNIYTVGAAAKGLADTILAEGKEDKGVIISYDSRNNSTLFAEIAARVIGSAGIKVLLSDELRPVPLLAFGIRHYSCAGGIMVTASHNPPEYNGFKVYGEDGGQLLPLPASQIKANMENIADLFAVVEKSKEINELIAGNNLKYIGKDLDDAYDIEIRTLFRHGRKDTSYRSRLKIVYTPLNGAGNVPVRRILKEFGFDQVFVVPDQEKPNGAFPTLRVPNPEYEDTYDMAIKMANAVAADIIIATDPDADRLGVAVRSGNGEFKILKGNMIGLLLTEYLLSVRAAADDIPDNSFCVTSIVSTKLVRSICRRYGVKLYQVFTGTKYIADKIQKLDEDGNETFIFGFEESHGYMIDPNVRDKDGVASAAMIAEIAAISKLGKRNLLDQLDSIYELYGYAADESYSIVCKGEQGRKQIVGAMEHYRYESSRNDGRLGSPGSKVHDIEVTKYIDFMPEADVLYYEIGDLDFVVLRPSGTEPKLKVYFGCYGKKGDVKLRLAKISGALLEDINNVIDSSR